MPSTYSCYAITAPGIEAITARELASFGIEPGRVEPGGVEFSATPAQLAAANVRSRTASRIIVRVAEFGARTFFELERHARKIPWERFVPSGAAVAFRAASRKSKLYHQGAIEERFLRWVGEAGYRGERGTGKGEQGAGDEGAEHSAGSQLFLVRVRRDRVTVSADSSGELLHRRGYRQATAKAPLRETLAAAMLLGSGWDGTQPLIDPCCGAGTIPIEAALIARGIAPGAARSFAAERWPESDPGTWSQIRSRVTAEARPRSPVPIAGSDQDAGAITAARANAARAGVEQDISFEQIPISAAVSRERHPGGWVVTNPPYGVRVGEASSLHSVYGSLGALARQRTPGGRLVVLAADATLAAEPGIPLEPVFETENGGIRVRCLQGRC